MITTVHPFAPMDYVRALEGIETPGITDRLEHGRQYAFSGPSYTIRIDGEIAAVLGLILHYPGQRHCRATGWAVWTPLGRRHPMVVHRLTVRYLRMLVRRYRIVRLDAEVVDEFAQGHVWAHSLGLDPEGPARLLAGPQGEAMQGYVWLHPDAAQVRAAPQAAVLLEPARRPDGSPIPAIAGAYVAAALIILTVAAAAVSAYATYQAGQQQKAAHKYQAKVAENQATMAAQQNEWAARQQRMRDRRVQAAARAAQGASGLEMTEGSSLLLDIDNARTAALNYEATRYSGEATQRNLMARAGLERFQGGVAARQATLGAGATLLGGLASAAGGGSGLARSPTPNTIRVPAGGTGSSGDIDLGYY